MKKVFIFTVLALTIATIGSCKKTKSAACDIVSFTVAGKPWQIDGLNITGAYDKTDNIANLTPDIVVSKGATWVSNPANAPFDFSGDKAVTFTVTAEDGKTRKVYTARVVVSGN